MCHAGSSKTVIIFDILNHQRRFVNDGIFGDAGFEINAIPGLDKFTKTNSRFNHKSFGLSLIKGQD